ncbi:hypothetical protein BG011_003450 [Mortierella polycephala]|uniref:Major facilitator superfamily (MFS) profile domain-containing protein n=1 Tax=Mortierella polycephala TaxID=41804 RepID=A0A9P6Q2P5_9FUNG|nr:hypothetical protein BG011_003450 [Mortierella polycephala]
MAQMLDIINVASVTIVLPKIMHDGQFCLRFGIRHLFGHRNIYMLGVAWFSIWAIVNGFAKNPIMMSVGRALQGMGAGFTVPSALAILTTTYPVGPERTKALSIFGGTAAVGSIVGVLLGGILGSTIGWRWMFYITGIIGFIILALGFFVIPAEKSQGIVEDRRLDVFGMVTFTAGIVLVIYYLSEGSTAGWASAKALAPFIVGIVLLITFVIIEFKIDYPIMPLHIWQSRRFVASCATMFFMMAALNAHFYFASLALQNVLGYTSLKTSLAFIPHGVGAIIIVAILSVLIGRVRTKIIIVAAWFFLIASGVLWAQLKATSLYWAIPFPSLILNTIAMSCIWLTCQINSVADAADEDQGVVGAVYNVCIQIGAPVGIAVSNIIANNKNSIIAVGPELLPGYRDAFYSFAVMAGVGLVVTLVISPNSDLVNSQAKDTETGEACSASDDDATIGHEK